MCICGHGDNQRSCDFLNNDFRYRYKYDSCEAHNEPSGSINCREFLDDLRKY